MNETPQASEKEAIKQRQHWMAVLARANEAELENRLGCLDLPEYRSLRAPEIGLAMVRGRTGGTGQPFNLGETTMTRCVIETVSGARGFGYVRGRNRRHAELAAIFDALLQERPELGQSVIQPLYEQWQAARSLQARKAASTRVDFMTMVRGE